MRGKHRSFSDKYRLALNSIIFNPTAWRSFSTSVIVAFLSPKVPPYNATSEGGLALPACEIIFAVVVVDIRIFLNFD